MKTAKELRELRRKWVCGPPPTSHEAAVMAQIAIDDLVEECFQLHKLCVRLGASSDDYSDDYQDALSASEHKMSESAKPATRGPVITKYDYKDDDGWHIVAACGHYVSGAAKEGDKIALCPNCQFLARFKSIEIVRPDRLPDEYKLE